MTEHAQKRIWSGIDIPKTIAGTLAAVSAAVVGSFLGVAGTLIGAAVASLISSIGTEIYHRYLDHGTKKLQAAFVTVPAAVGTPEVAAAPQPPSAPEEETSGTTHVRWKRIAFVAASLFVLAMGTLTAAELLAGRSAADATSGRDGGSPTVFDLRGNDSTDEKPAPATSSTPADSDQGTAPASEPATEPGEDATTTPPADSATTEPTPQETTEAPDGETPTGGTETGGAGIEQGAGEEPQQ